MRAIQAARLTVQTPVDPDQHPYHHQRRPPPAKIHDQKRPHRHDAAQSGHEIAQGQRADGKAAERARILHVIARKQHRLHRAARRHQPERPMHPKDKQARHEHGGGEGPEVRRDEHVLDACFVIDGKKDTAYEPDM